ncbi:MAG: hypothetical protein V1728_03600 [Candidatus Micrarchaeota archaeon]
MDGEAGAPGGSGRHMAGSRRISRRDARAQVSLEYTIISAVMLVVLVILMVTFNGLYSQYALKTQYQQAEHAIAVVGASATDVWKQGKYAREQVLIDIPARVDLGRSNISKNVLDLYLDNAGDVSMQLPFLLNGSWPDRTGRTVMVLYNNGTHVITMPGGEPVPDDGSGGGLPEIPAGGLELNTSVFYMSFPSNSPTQKSGLELRNRAGVSYALAYVLTCPANANPCKFNPTNPPSSIAAGQTQDLEIQLNPKTVGFSAGYLTITATPPAGSGLPVETYTIPIEVHVT